MLAAVSAGADAGAGLPRQARWGACATGGGEPGLSCAGTSPPGWIEPQRLARAPPQLQPKDQPQARFPRQPSRRCLEPAAAPRAQHARFAHAALHGLGWGMNPEALVAPLLASGDLVEIAPWRASTCRRNWQRWSLEAEVVKGTWRCRGSGRLAAAEADADAPIWWGGD